jgi:hypothetical protein
VRVLARTVQGGEWCSTDVVGVPTPHIMDGSSTQRGHEDAFEYIFENFFFLDRQRSPTFLSRVAWLSLLIWPFEEGKRS